MVFITVLGSRKLGLFKAANENKAFHAFSNSELSVYIPIAIDSFSMQIS
jgi:hypothetical protein